MDGTGLGWMARPALIGGALGLGGFLLLSMAGTPTPAFPKPAFAPDSTPPARESRPFRNCTEARAAGHAPVYRGDPAYGPWLDGDDDGIGCEPYYGQ